MNHRWTTALAVFALALPAFAQTQKPKPKPKPAKLIKQEQEAKGKELAKKLMEAMKKNGKLCVHPAPKLPQILIPHVRVNPGPFVGGRIRPWRPNGWPVGLVPKQPALRTASYQKALAELRVAHQALQSAITPAQVRAALDRINKATMALRRSLWTFEAKPKAAQPRGKKLQGKTQTIGLTIQLLRC